jgi:sec-independent protein translocase protein TatA
MVLNRESKGSHMLADIFGEQGIIVLIIIVVVLFGGTQIPKIARSLGSAQSEFKKGIEEGKKESEASDKDTNS